MKHVLIGGVGRSGKSRLANLLLKRHGYSVLRGDRIWSALKRAHPEIHVEKSPTQPIEQAVRERTPFLLTLLANLAEYDDIPYVLDSALLTPDVVRAREESLSICVPVFLGYPNVTREEKVEKIRAYAAGRRDCVSIGMSDEELAKWVDKWIDESKALENQCRLHGYRFVDTSTDFDTVLASAAEAIVSQGREKEA